MALYNPMVMSKLIWTRNAARLNPFNTDSFLWIDGGHLCNNPVGITSAKFQFFNQFFDKMLITYVAPRQSSFLGSHLTLSPPILPLPGNPSRCCNLVQTFTPSVSMQGWGWG